MFHPLGGYSLQKGTRIFAIIDLVLCVLFFLKQILFVVFINLRRYFDEPNSELYTQREANKTITENGIGIVKTDEDTWEPMVALVITSYILYTLYFVVEVWLYRLLTRASKNRDLRATKHWFLVRLVITIVILILGILSCFLSGPSGIEFVLLNLFYRIYELVVVNAYKKELEQPH